MAVVAFLPHEDAEKADKVERFAVAREYPIDHREGDLDNAKRLLRKGDVLLMHSLFDIGQDGNQGLQVISELTDRHGVVVVTVRENYVLKDDTMSHFLAGMCFLTQMMTEAFDQQEKK